MAWRCLRRSSSGISGCPVHVSAMPYPLQRCGKHCLPSQAVEPASSSTERCCPHCTCAAASRTNHLFVMRAMMALCQGCTPATSCCRMQCSYSPLNFQQCKAHDLHKTHACLQGACSFQAPRTPSGMPALTNSSPAVFCLGTRTYCVFLTARILSELSRLTSVNWIVHPDPLLPASSINNCRVFR